MKTLIILLFPILLLAQSKQIAVMGGYKAGEISISYTAPNELIYGLAVTTVDSKIAEKRANNNDINIHKFNNKYVPGVFGLIGGKFDDLSIIGKLGTAYINQNINNITEKQKYYFTAGIAIDYKISETIGLRGSYDSVSSLLLGVTFHIN
jgi:hypothetical protein